MKPRIIAALLAAVIALASAFIPTWEGSQPVGYRDIAGIATACEGHTGADVVVGVRYSPEQCATWLKSDVGKAAVGVGDCVDAPLKVYEWAAFTSLAYNIGTSAFCKSSIARKANSHDMPGACAAIELYVYAGGRRVEGLVRRRASERALCEGKS